MTTTKKSATAKHTGKAKKTSTATPADNEPVIRSAQESLAFRYQEMLDRGIPARYDGAIYWTDGMWILPDGRVDHERCDD